MGIFSGLFKSRDKPQNRTAGSNYAFFFGGTTSGKAVTERSAMQMTAVYSCVRILSEAVAGLPLHLYKYTDSGGKAMALDHPLYRLLHDEPNPEMSSFVFRETLMTHLLLWGNAYAQIIRNGKNEIVALYPLMPNKMSVDRDENGRLYYTYYRGSDEAIKNKEFAVTLQPSDVLHIPGLGFDGLVGYSPIAMAKNAIGMAIACEEYGAKFFANGAAPGGVLEHPGTIKDPQRVRESWQSTFGGSGNANKIAVLEEGMKYTPIGISPEQAQFLETRKFQINEIARIFRVPPHMVGDLEKSSFSNIEQQSLEFVKYTLDPWVIRWEQSIQRSLLSKDEKAVYFVKFNLEGLLRGDYQSRMNGYAIGRQNGWMSANDIRELENLDRIPAEDGGDLYLMVLTVHRWFANKSCPGNWMYARMGDLASKVTAALGGDVKPADTVKPTPVGIKAGDLVTITGSTYYNGKAIPGWVKKLRWYVVEVSGDRTVINKDESGRYAIMSPVKTSALAVAGTKPSEDYRIHTVVHGDTLWAIAKKYLGNGSRYKEIVSLNGLKSNVIYSGMKLKIPNK